ncbi:MAG: TolC family protein, partial [Fimbriimonadaceae bacterium]
MKQKAVLLGLYATALFSNSIFAQVQDLRPAAERQIDVPASAASLTLEEAWRLAEQLNPALKSATAGRVAAEGQLTDSRAPLWHNPELSYQLNRRSVPQTGTPVQRFREWDFGLSQTFEIAGQRGFRLDAARADLDALDAAIAELRQQLRADVEERFVKVLALQRRIALERENLKLVENASDAVGKRFAAG